MSLSIRREAAGNDRFFFDSSTCHHVSMSYRIKVSSKVDPLDETHLLTGVERFLITLQEQRRGFWVRKEEAPWSIARWKAVFIITWAR